MKWDKDDVMDVIIVVLFIIVTIDDTIVDFDVKVHNYELSQP
jgi:hypothetical protein